MTDKNFEEEVNENEGKLVYEQKFKGRPVLVMKKNHEDKFPLAMGMAKIRVVLDNIQAIEAFAAKHSKDRE